MNRHERRHDPHYKKKVEAAIKKCFFCKGTLNIHNEGDFKDCIIKIDEDSNEVIIDITDNEQNDYQQWFTINYCPICGRKLRRESEVME